MVRTNKKVRLFSALEIANICGVVNQTAINWIKKGHLRAFITPGGQYRVYANELFNFLSARGMEIPEYLQVLHQEHPNETTEQQSTNKSVATTLIISENKGSEKKINSLLTSLFADDCLVITLYSVQGVSKAISDHKPMFVIVDTSSVEEDKVAIIKEFVEQLKKYKILASYSQIIPVSFETFNTMPNETMESFIDKNTYTDLRFLPKLLEKIATMVAI